MEKSDIAAILRGITEHLNPTLSARLLTPTPYLRARIAQSVLAAFEVESELRHVTATGLNTAAVVYQNVHGGLPGFESPDWEGLKVEAREDYCVLSLGPAICMFDPNMVEWVRLGIPLRGFSSPIDAPELLVSEPMTVRLPYGEAIVYQPVMPTGKLADAPNVSGVVFDIVGRIRGALL